MASGGRVGDSRSATLCSTPLRCTPFVARERDKERNTQREGGRGREREFGRRGYKAHAMPAEHERRGILVGVGVSRGSRSVEKGRGRRKGGAKVASASRRPERESQSPADLNAPRNLARRPTNLALLLLHWEPETGGIFFGRREEESPPWRVVHGRNPRTRINPPAVSLACRARKNGGKRERERRGKTIVSFLSFFPTNRRIKVRIEWIHSWSNLFPVRCLCNLGLLSFVCFVSRWWILKKRDVLGRM